jgi:predicted TIM-barrel fold metal-dependent hydrolase
VVDIVDFLINAAGEKGDLHLRPDPQPRERRYTVISVDDHLIEPPDTFTGRLPKKFEGIGPRIERADNGTDWWVFEEERIPLLAADAIQSWAPGEGYLGPITFEELRPAVYKIDDRVRDMDINGVAASLNFPSAPFGFAGQGFMRMMDPVLGLASMRAFNDWVYEEWYSPYPDRIIPCQVTWLHDPKLAAAEIERNAARGFRAVSFSENPWKLGLPSMHQRHWDPFLGACEETETVINLHVGSSSETFVPGPDSVSVLGILFPINGFAACADWLYAGVPVRFPKIKIALSEGGIGWVPMMLDRLEYTSRHGVSSHLPFGDMTPVELLHRNFWFTTFSDPRTLALRDEIGIDRIMIETDYPHSDSSWPDTQELLAKQLKGFSKEEADKVTFDNAAALYQHPAPRWT